MIYQIKVLQSIYIHINISKAFLKTFPQIRANFVEKLYGSPAKPGFIECLDNCLRENNIPNIQECYLVVDFNVILLSEKEILWKKQYSDYCSQTEPLFKNYVDLCFFNSLHQIIGKATRTNEAY